DPCPYINTYGGEGKILPDYVIETLRIMADEDWIDEIVVLGMTEKALRNLRMELRAGEIDVGITEALQIERYDFSSLVEWTVKFIREKGMQERRVVMAYDEPLSALLSAGLKSYILPLSREMDKLPEEYKRILGEHEVEEVILIAHAKDVEESWKTQKIIGELNSLPDLENSIISGDMLTLSREVNLTIFQDAYRSKLCFISGANEIPILTPLAMETDALIIRCGYDNFDIRFQNLLHELQVRRCAITEAPDRIMREDLDTWFYISTRARGAVEATVGPWNVYRLWANQPRDVILKLMEKYKSLDTMAHVLYWGVERKIMETMFKIAQ
ncbi:MAG: hypothetical protein ACP5QI_06625, partial [Candidatus Bathyarchaeia archaeon]